MAATGPISAVIAKVGLPGRLERIRLAHDPAAALGDRRPVGAVHVRFGAVGRFPRVVFLAPEPAARAGHALPFTRRVTAIEVLTEDPSGRWRRHWRIPLAVRP